MQRCAWAEGDPLMAAYHDQEWGTVERDSRRLWAKLVLDGFQAGLSWRTILHKREAFRAAFDDFDPETIAAYGEADVARLMADPGIVRSRAKIAAAIGNARAYIAMAEKGEDFSAFVWGINGEPLKNHWTATSQVPAESETSVALSKALKARGFKFVGPVIVYAWMQAVGMVDDHLITCFRRSLPLPGGEREGPAPQAWEGEGA